MLPTVIQHGLISSCSTTALQSIEIARDTLLSGEAKVMIAGGFDDISGGGSYEFANMKATSNSETEFAMGCEPPEMSWPATTPVPASWSPREVMSIPSCPPGPPSNSVLPSGVSSGSLPLPRETLVLCVCGVRSDPVDVTATRPDDPFLHREWERSPSPARSHRNTHYQSWTSTIDPANSPSAVSRDEPRK